ncbi:flavin oxidoreductase / NADH oxidase family protein, partial [Vibrio parahaemolyticus V-223/04]
QTIEQTTTVVHEKIVSVFLSK